MLIFVHRNWWILENSHTKFNQHKYTTRSQQTKKKKKKKKANKVVAKWFIHTNLAYQNVIRSNAKQKLHNKTTNRHSNTYKIIAMTNI